MQLQHCAYTMAVHLLVDGFDFNPVALKKLLAIDGEAVPSIRECISSALFEIYVGMGNRNRLRVSVRPFPSPWRSAR
jgi:hypothetical protein